MPDIVIGIKHGRAAMPDDTALFDDGVMVGQSDQAFDIFIYDQDGLPGATQACQAAPDFFANQRRQALGGLIEDQQAGIGGQGAANGEHLLFATRQLVAQMVLPLGQLREEGEDLGDSPWIASCMAIGGEGDEMLAHRQVGEDLATFRHQGDALAGDQVRAQPGESLSGKADLAGACRHHAADGANRRGLAHAVSAQQGGDLTLLDAQIDVEQYLAGAIGGLQGVNIEQCAHLQFVAQIRAAHSGVFADEAWRTAGDDATADQYRDAIGQAEDDVHVVFHQEHSLFILQ